MTRGEILGELEALASEHLEFRGALQLEAPLEQFLELDSLRLLILLAEVENRFRIQINPEEEADLQTIEDLVLLIERKLSGRLMS